MKYDGGGVLWRGMWKKQCSILVRDGVVQPYLVGSLVDIVDVDAIIVSKEDA